MKKINVLALLLISTILLISSCAHDKTFYKKGEQIKADTYGFADKQEHMNPDVVYEVSFVNVIWSIVGVETLIIPVWLTGWYFYEPVRLKTDREIEFEIQSGVREK